MEVITPRYTASVETSKNSYIVKLNSSLLFYDGFNADKRVNWNLLLAMHDLTL